MDEHHGIRGFCLRLASALVAVFLCLGQLPAQAVESNDTLRVAFPIQPGLTERDIEGNPTGYTYEYLQEIAQYTGWNYEFITPEEQDMNASLTACLKMLERGEVDLMGGLLYSDALAETYDYPAYSYGNVYTVLAVLDEDGALTEGSLPQLDELRVAVPATSVLRVEELEQFCAMNKTRPVLIPCQTKEEQIAALRDGSADAMLDVDLSLSDGLRTIAHFAPRPFYFAATKGNDALVSKLNSAIVGINEADPYFAVGLYEKYFDTTEDTLRLSEEEKAYIRGAGKIRVAVGPDWIPVQDVDPDTGEFTGISRGVFDYITQNTGLTFQFVPGENMGQMSELLSSGTVELASGVPYDYTSAEKYGLALSRPYLEAQTAMALAKGLNAEDLRGRRLAISKGVLYDGDITSLVTVYNSVEECLAAVSRGDADFTYGNSYVIQYYTSQSRYRNMDLFIQPGESQRLCIGIVKPVNTTLLTILNKAVRSLPAEELRAIIYRNAAPTAKVTLASFVIDNPLLVVGIVAGTALAIILLLAVFFRVRIRLVRRSALENERYRLLGELTNEHIFEYDFTKDRVTLTERSAQALGTVQVREHYRLHLEQDRSLLAENMRDYFTSILRDGEGTEDLCIALADGRRRWFRVASKVISDSAGKPVLAVGRLTDIQRERETLEHLSEKARRDSLTGVYNVEATRQIVTHKMGERAGPGGALLVLDVDNFKSINDQHGHFVGDQALIALAEVLEEVFRRSDVVGRQGGDEFMIFMDRVTDRVMIEDKCRQVLAAVDRLPPPMAELNITVSIGAALADGQMDYSELYQRADKALYMVKARGRNGYELL